MTSYILSKPQLSEQGLNLLSLLDLIPSHRCLSSRRTAGIYYLLNNLYPLLTTPSKWNHVFQLLLVDATNELGRSLVWQVLCRLLQEEKISLMNFISVLNCSLKTIENYRETAWGRQVIEFIFALTMYCNKLNSVTETQETNLLSLENIPTADQCWLHCINVLKSFADSSLKMGAEVGVTGEFHCRLLRQRLTAYSVAFCAKTPPSPREEPCSNALTR